MKTLSVVKKDLDFNRGLSSLIDVLKNIAVAQYRTLEQKIKSFEKFGQEVESFFDFIDLAQVDHPFVRPQNNSQAVVAVTSDSGLLGGLNMQVVSVAIAELEKIPGKLVVIGERGKMYAQESKIPFTAFPGIKDEERFGQAIQLRDYLVAKALEGSFHHLKIVYPRPISFTVQRIEKLSVLPFSLASQEKGLVKAIPEFISESSFADVAEYLLYLWLGQKIYEIFGLSRLAEFSARYVHLEESLQKLKEMDTKLRLEYFRVRHELIDRSMRELFSARLLYAQ
jgi:ATP synthase F1 gamma subunit